MRSDSDDEHYCSAHTPETRPALAELPAAPVMRLRSNGSSTGGSTKLGSALACPECGYGAYTSYTGIVQHATKNHSTAAVKRVKALARQHKA